MKMQILIAEVYGDITPTRRSEDDNMKTGEKALASMLKDGMINQPFLWIDTYNQRVDVIAGTIKARIDSNNMFYVSVKNNKMAQKEDKKYFVIPQELQGKDFRIRKITPKECFRLMGVSEDDIDKLLNANISDSSLYKLAGNSIVVDTLYWQFYKAFINTENDSQQLTLF